jgi:hypothetical protein
MQNGEEEWPPIMTKGHFLHRVPFESGPKNRRTKVSEKVSLCTDEQVLESPILIQGLWRLLDGKTRNLHDNNLKQTNADAQSLFRHEIHL